jgi:putative endonuclease
MAKQFYVYILASKRNGTLYTGVTSNLIQRVWQHKHEVIQGFTRKYNIKTLRPSYIMKYMKMRRVPSQEKRKSKSGEEHGSWA